MVTLDRPTIYDAIYQLAAGDGREELLFGPCAPLAHEAFQRSLVTGGFPLIWFELPLLGAPRFDLHVALSPEALRNSLQLPDDFDRAYAPALTWYAHEEQGGNGLAFAYDVSEGRIDAPALHVNVNDAPLENIGRFFELAAGADTPKLYQRFVDRLPKGWRVWYAGVHPARPGSHLRVDCFVNRDLKAAYASDLALLERDLRSCGFTTSLDALEKLVQPILSSPFTLELQFDINRDGSIGPTLGISAEIPHCLPANAHPEVWMYAARLMHAVEAMGLADERWKAARGASYALSVEVNGSDLKLYCMPTFVKLRMRDGVPLDAKLYLIAGAIYPE